MTIEAVTEHEVAAGNPERVYPRFEQVPVAAIFYQTDRTYGGNGDITKLAESMGKVGLIQPIVLRPEGAGRYRIIAGRRRYEAAKALGWPGIAAKVVDTGDGDDEEVSLAENVNREDMSPLDEAEIFQRQLAGGRDIAELARYYNRSVSAIYQRIRLTRLAGRLKDFFREGKLGITAAAMLSSLDERHQEDFLARFGQYSDIDASQVETFLHSVQHNRLVGLVDTKCRKCEKRTTHTDRNLFPELDNLQDVCFDDDCYAKKWTALLAKLIKKEKANHPDTADILVLDGIPKFYTGRTLVLNGTEYQIKKYTWENQAYPNDTDAFYVWELYAAGESGVRLERKRYKEKEKKPKPEKPVSAFGVDAIIGEAPGDVPAEERTADIRSADRALKNAYGREENFQNAVEDDLWKKVIRKNREKPCGDIFKVYVALRAKEVSAKWTSEFYELITGFPYTEDLAGIESIPPETLLEVIFAWDLLENYYFPDPEEAEDEPFLQFAGITADEYRDLYRETARELLNKALTGGEAGSGDFDGEGEES